MGNLFRNIRLVTAACLLTACSPARTAVIGQTLTTNVKPYVSITGLAPLSVKAHGKLLLPSLTESATVTEDVSFNYAVFADNDTPGLNRLAYAAIVRLAHPNMWTFQPAVPTTEAFSVESATLDDIQWSIQTLRISPEGDWASTVWQLNDRSVPAFWLAKRWVASLDGTTKAVMEYREPWPKELPRPVPGMAVGNGSGGEALQAFITRADVAFRVKKKEGNFSGNASAPASRLHMPKAGPHIPALVGGISRATGN